MEVLPCSGASYLGECDCPELGSETASRHDGKAVYIRGKEQIGADIKIDGLNLNLEGFHEARKDESELVLTGFPALGGGTDGNASYEFDVDGQNISCEFHDPDDDNLEKEDHFAGPGVSFENSQLAWDTLESGTPNDQGISHIEIKALELDEPEAVWVKWRGLWQSGIRCARTDWPLSTLRAKPTHDRKQYIIIFFPRTRNYSWADVLLVRPINELPLPIAYKTHKVGVQMVKDLSLARRFIIQKLAVSMLNTLDQLHQEALLETARDVMVLKEFTIEASRCKDYPDLGRVLLKLENLILRRCFHSHWLQHSLQSWKQRCLDANSAECIEILKEELSNSISWNEVNALSSKAPQVEMGSDWRSWKHEVMRLFSVSHPVTAVPELEQPNNDGTLSMEPQLSRKRPKLEVRRADSHASSSHMSVPIETDTTFFGRCNSLNTGTLVSEILKNENSVEAAALTGSPGCAANKWDDIVVEEGNSEVNQTKVVELTTPSIVAPKPLDPGNHNRQCAAFIEAKGRQCVRYANEGDIYCCVHLVPRFTGSSVKTEATPPVDSPMCGGTTIHGNKCKHRALIGYSYCKKHRPQDSKKIACAMNILERKSEEAIIYPGNQTPANVLLVREDGTPIQVNPSFDVGRGFIPGSSPSVKPEQSQQTISNTDMVQCIGSWPRDGEKSCAEIPKRHSLYCKNHIPSWLKRARNGKSRIMSKEVFVALLRDCHSREQKLQLHQACELFYRLFRSILSSRNPVPKEVQFQWAISEASKDGRVGDSLMKLVCNEIERLRSIWGFGEGQNLQSSSTIEDLVPVPTETPNNNHDHDKNILKCKICSEKFVDDQALGLHWMDIHKKEAQWLFRGYVCAICLDSFTNKKVLEAHVQERHHVEFVEQCLLLQCIPCGGHFGNTDQLWSHVLSVHSSNFRLSNNPQEQHKGSLQKVQLTKSVPAEHMKSENQSGNRRYICRFCGLKFDLLPDLGRHHQAAHMGQKPTGPRLTKKGIQYYAQKLKSGRLTRPRFKKGLTSTSYKIRNRSVQNLKKRIQASNLVGPKEIVVQSSVPETGTLGRLADPQCLTVAKELFYSETKKTKPWPSNTEILLIASSACCKVSLQASLEVKYGTLPERIYLKAAKLCSEHNIIVEWHKEGFICPKGCIPAVRAPILPPLVSSSDYIFKARSSMPSHLVSEWTMDESHCIIDSRYFSIDLSEKNIILCDDISFGQEPVPIACVVDENLLNAKGPDGQMTDYTFPWENFTYITKPLLDQSLVLDVESSQLGCACAHSNCSSETCDHVYLFENDYEDAKDIYGNSMHGRFPYDKRGRIILEEGYLVYECNQRCRCSKACQNRVLQNGVQVRLEVFKTEKKGWAVRAREAILRGTFVCEYIGEVINEEEANERRNRSGIEGCRYFYEIDAHINDMSRLIEGQVPYVIDATKYGNVSRYINHSCSPNLMNHQVLVDSMDSQLAHIGLYASRDIALGEELTYDFRYKPLPGEGCPCECGASNCKGRLY